MNQASNIKVILPGRHWSRTKDSITDLPRFTRDFDDKVAGLQHEKSLVILKLKKHLAGRPDHTAWPWHPLSCQYQDSTELRPPDEQNVKDAKRDAGGIISPVKISISPSKAPEAIPDGTCYWQLSAESKELDEYLFGQLQSAVVQC